MSLFIFRRIFYGTYIGIFSFSTELPNHYFKKNIDNNISHQNMFWSFYVYW